MAIDAVVKEAVRNPDNSVTLCLLPRDVREPGDRIKLIVIDAPPHLEEAVIDIAIWGSSGFLLVGDKLWAEQISSTRCRLVSKLKKVAG